MRFIAGIAFVVPVVVVIWVLVGGPRPESAAQVAAMHAVDSLTRVRVAALGRHEIDAWGAALRSDALLLGDDGDPARIGRVEAVDEMRRELGSASDAASALDFDVMRVATGATRRGRLAWAAVSFDDSSSAIGDDRPNVPLRHTTAYLFRDNEWRVLLEIHAHATNWDVLRVRAAVGRCPAPAALTASEGRDASRLAKRFRRALAHFGRIRVDQQAIAVGPTGDIAVGDSAVNAMFADWEGRLGAPRLATDGLRASVPHRADVGSVLANLEASPPGWTGGALPLRFAGVYRERGEDGWSLVLAHLSVAMAAREVEGTPIP